MEDKLWWHDPEGTLEETIVELERLRARIAELEAVVDKIKYKSTDLPFIAIGNNELGKPLGDTVTCGQCGKQHPVEYGAKKLMPDGTWQPSNLLATYKCGSESFLCGIDGKEIQK